LLSLVYSSQITDRDKSESYMQYGYDEMARVTAPGIGASQNLDLSPRTAPYYGNQTTVNRWLNLLRVQTLKSTTTNYNTGMPSIATDPLNNQTTYFTRAPAIAHIGSLARVPALTILGNCTEERDEVNSLETLSERMCGRWNAVVTILRVDLNNQLRLPALLLFRAPDFRPSCFLCG